MNDDAESLAQVRGSAGSAVQDGHFWPPPDYGRQLDALRAAVGETVFVAELELTDVQLGARLTDKPYVLLGIVDFPRPDPERGLAPHLVLLDDGRGVNLGRIARITRSRPFSPSPNDVLYQDEPVLHGLLFSERRLSLEYIAHQSRRLLGELLGADTVGRPLLDAPDAVDGKAAGRPE